MERYPQSGGLYDKVHDIAEVTSIRLFSAGKNGGLLYGPRSPKYGQTAQ
ncbi:hypothetical protein FEM41_11535 [Jejubacter calystegiae]|uniref:Uncharacterized protein n=1 Tax=Jejubacter calystegiae TaxID=2579935 RepID=A0A4P8YP36_9ENTR|nr:hypothetical protein FEM41_11535 [Jejubacter calystegiae]